MQSRARSREFTVCIHNGEDEVDLIVGKIYRGVRAEPNDRSADIRVVDESGENYLYPRSWFVPVELPLRARRALVGTEASLTGSRRGGRRTAEKA